MAEDYQAAAGICGETWWNPSRSVFAGCLTPCGSTGIGGGDAGSSFGWDHMKSSSLSCTDNISNNNNGSTVSSSSIVFAQKQQEADSDSGGSTITIDSTLQMMGLGFSSSGNSSSDWNQSILQEDMSSSLMGTTSQDCQGFLSAGFAVNPSAPSSYGFSSLTLLENLCEPELNPNQSSLLSNNRSSINNYMSSNTTSACSNDFSSLSWPKTDPFLKVPSLLQTPKQQASGFNFSNNTTPFWNSSASAANIMRSTFLPSSQPASDQFLATRFEAKPFSSPNLTTKSSATGEVRDSGSALKKANGEPALKKQRITTPSPLPTFKVRKENLRDQITALQQLVSPFGKTDTASVLQEAIEYIKFLHDQVSVLSTPYMKQGASVQPQQSSHTKDPEGHNQDLRSRGLCLVPLSSTFPVANETTADFWTPTFGGNFR